MQPGEELAEQVAQAIDEEVRSIVDRQYQRARQILVENREMVDRIVSVLLVKETLEREAFMAIMQGAPLPPDEESISTPPQTGTPVQTEEPPRQQLRLRAEPGPA